MTASLVRARHLITRTLDRDAVLRALHEDLSRALADDEVERRALAKALLPHVRRFYEGYVEPGAHRPFYRQNSMV